MESKKRRLLWAFAAAYSAIMLYLLLFRSVGASELPYRQQLRYHFNAIPFHTIRRFWRVLLRSHDPNMLCQAAINLFGNIFLFLPLGTFPPLLWEKMRSFPRTVALAAAIMAVIEISQMLLLVGTCDIDDIILNVLGAAMGYWCYVLISK